jgi:hypothetical protein
MWASHPAVYPFIHYPTSGERAILSSVNAVPYSEILKEPGKQLAPGFP